ncbi:hypothetical protein EJ02DRAFT_512129 [Clathrospora elynae]|uniref:WH2 domain-containing protein n=1 Tax=Clathrospora elynae TaxID=706981 RepID=A0A6A5SQ42_9PLEO|nr:hypothetical protein EJ02DRAFT_512129 [Clathrospora elynae]
MPPPPPPPPMPPMGRGAGGPPPPPPMPGMKAPGGKPPSGAGRSQGALLGDISKGARLKKVTQINDRSSPIVGKVNDAPSGAPMGAPAIPGMGKPPAVPGLAPPVPGGGNRARSNSDTAGGENAMAAPPQLGGLFAGGMPKLRKSGGVKTGAEQSSTPYLSDPETSRSSVPRPPRGAAPKPPGAPPAPPIPGGRPPLHPIRGGLMDSRPSSVASSISMKPKPPPPIGKKPPMPPPSSRKPSGLAPPPPLSAARAPPVPGGAPPAPPPPPPSSTPSAPPPRPGGVPPAPPLPPSAAPRAPVRSTLPPPPPPSAPPPLNGQYDDDEYDPYKYSASPPPKAPPLNGHAPSLAEQAARNAFGRASPAAPPPPPPASAPAPPPPPSPALSRPASQTPLRSMLDPSSYTLTNGGSGVKSPANPSMGSGTGQKGKVMPIHDLRWRFQDEAQFPRPREFSNGPKRYRAGRGSSVPLDLSAFD